MIESLAGRGTIVHCCTDKPAGFSIKKEEQRGLDGLGKTEKG